MSNEPRPLNYGRHLVEDDDIAAVVAVLKGDLITQGPVVARFETMVAERVGARHAVAVSNGTAALHIACLAAGVGPSDFGLTSALTFVASANAFIYCGATAGLVDVDPDTIAMTPADLERAIRERPETRAVIPVHIAGLAQDMSAIRKIVGTRTIIEDASHALGAFYANGRPVGCCDDTDMAVFSFHPVKPITTGEGGMITTNDDELARRLRLLRNHGIERAEERFVSPGQADPDGEGTAPWYQEQQVMGFNFRMSDIHAALGLSQLHKLDEFIARRREIAYYYDAEFSSLKHVRPLHAAPADRDRSSLHLYVVDVDFEALGVSRTSFVNALRKWNVGTQIHYLPVYRHPYHRAGGVHAEVMFPGAERYHRGCLSLPLFQGLANEEADRVVAAVRYACGA